MHKRKRSTWLILLLIFVMTPSALGLRCFDDSEMIERHEQKLDEEDD